MHTNINNTVSKFCQVSPLLVTTSAYSLVSVLLKYIVFEFLLYPKCIKMRFPINKLNSYFSRGRYRYILDEKYRENVHTLMWTDELRTLR